MANYKDEKIGRDVATPSGDYTIVALVHDDCNADQSIDLYVGKAADGHHDLLARDNASFWAVGDENDAALNRDQWAAIAERCDVAPVLDEVRRIDAELADWLDNRYQEATTALVTITSADVDDWAKHFAQFGSNRFWRMDDEPNETLERIRRRIDRDRARVAELRKSGSRGDEYDDGTYEVDYRLQLLKIERETLARAREGALLAGCTYNPKTRRYRYPGEERSDAWRIEASRNWCRA